MEWHEQHEGLRSEWKIGGGMLGRPPHLGWRLVLGASSELPTKIFLVGNMGRWSNGCPAQTPHNGTQ